MKIEINLSQHKYEKKLVTVFFYVFIAGSMASALFYNYRSIHIYNDQLAGLNERNASLSRELEDRKRVLDEKGLSKKDLDALTKKINYVNLLIEKQAFSWTGLIYHLEKNTPGEINITEITPAFDKNNIRIVGLAKTVDDIVKFVNNLQRSDYFKDAFLLEHNKTEIEGNKLVGFIITSGYIKEQI